MQFLSLNDAISLDLKQSNELFGKYINPGLMKAFSILGFNDMDIENAEGVEIHLRDGRTVLDFSASIGVLGLGHNHPRIIAAERLCHEKKLIDALKVAPIKLQAALAYNLCQMLPDPLQMAFFTVSGAEAVEAAMKLCEKIQGRGKTKFITTTGSYHGKTHGTLPLTKSGGFQDGFLLGIPDENVIEIPYGDVKAVESAIQENQADSKSNSIIAIILEPIQGQGVVESPPGYLTDVAALCRENEILVIFDEVKVGMGRTGTFCAFERDQVVPDALTLSKALGGGKRAIGAMITSEKLFKKAYGKRKDCALHTTTFGGLGESCAVAIETLNIFHEENIVDSVMEKGDYLKDRLSRLMDKHRNKIIEIRGRGLFQGVKFDFSRKVFEKVVDTSRYSVFNTLDSIMMACIIRQLYRKYNIITLFSASDPDVLHIMPPLIVEKSHLAQFTDALDDILSKGWNKLIAKFISGNMVDICR